MAGLHSSSPLLFVSDANLGPAASGRKCAFPSGIPFSPKGMRPAQIFYAAETGKGGIHRINGLAHSPNGGTAF